MDPTATSHPESVNHSLADFLDSRKTAIHAEWLQRARQVAPAQEPAREPSIPPRVPSLVDDLNTALRCSRAPRIASLDPDPGEGSGGSPGDAALCEQLCGIKHFRGIILYHLRTFEDLHPDHGLAAMLFVSTIVHRFLDDAMIEIARKGRGATK